MRGARTSITQLFCLTCALVFSCCYALAADQKAAKSAELRQLQIEIKQLRSTLDQARDKQQDLHGELSGIEKEIKAHQQLVNDTDQELNKKRAELLRLQKEKNQQQITLREQQQHLRQQLLIAYAGGHQESLKILLNGDNPATIGRVLVYHQYLSQDRAQEVTSINSAIERIDTLANAIEHQTQELNQLRTQRANDQTVLERKLGQRKTLLAQINSEIGTKQQRLQRLIEDERRLESLLRKLNRAKRSKPDAKPSTFAALQGKLTWPIRGSLAAKFGAPRQLGEKKWQGVLIAAKNQQHVNVIADGQVVFADELRGFGLLLIVDHGGNYLSLYGNNSSAYKKTGSRVRAGEAIAMIGNGSDQTGLYFEIRHKGTPINPALWCKGQP